jgi:ADP-ribosyl-[dinitrogen reductase] hydrolase
MSARRTFVDASTRITHSDPRAAESARMIAEAAALACERAEEEAILTGLELLIGSAEMKTRFPLLRKALSDRIDVASFADQFGRRPGFVSGFAPDSAAVALFAWLRHRGDFRATIESVVSAGGDTDTVAFIAGSLAGIDVGQEGMPADWLSGLRDWPLSVSALQKIGTADGPRYPRWPLSFFRNLLFFGIVLMHGFRRLLPPY